MAETIGELMERKLEQYTDITRCLTNHMGMNMAGPFRNCTGCPRDNMCQNLVNYFKKDFGDAKYMWEKHNG